MTVLPRSRRFHDKTVTRARGPLPQPYRCSQRTEGVQPPRFGSAAVPHPYLQGIRQGSTGVPRGQGVPVTVHGLVVSPCDGHGGNPFPELQGEKDRSWSPFPEEIKPVVTEILTTYFSVTLGADCGAATSAGVSEQWSPENRSGGAAEEGARRGRGCMGRREATADRIGGEQREAPERARRASGRGGKG